jgi:hypothetical protein
MQARQKEVEPEHLEQLFVQGTHILFSPMKPEGQSTEQVWLKRLNPFAQVMHEALVEHISQGDMHDEQIHPLELGKV